MTLIIVFLTLAALVGGAIWWLNRHPVGKQKAQEELDKAVQKAKAEAKKL